MERGVTYVLQNYETAPGRVAAWAVPFLQLFGTVGSGWLVVKAALAAEARAKLEGDATGFYASKVLVATHYARHILPLAHSYLVSVLEGADSTLAFDVACL